jgi:hypothetical protein
MTAADETKPTTDDSAVSDEATAAPPVVDQMASTANSNVEAAAATADTMAQAASAAGGEAVRRIGDASTAAATEADKAFQDVRERLRSFGVPGTDPAATLTGPLLAGTDVFSKSMTAGYGQAAETLSEFNAKAVEAWRANAEAAIAHWQQLTGVASWSEAVALNTAHARKQIEVITAQTRELAEIAGRMAREGAKKFTSQS